MNCPETLHNRIAPSFFQDVKKESKSLTKLLEEERRIMKKSEAEKEMEIGMIH